MKFRLLTVLAWSVNICLAQDHVISLWEESPPNSKPSDQQETQVITHSLRISHVVHPTLEVYLPSKTNASGKAVMICPGGGYKLLAYDKEGTDIAKWLNGHGIAGIVLKYRLPEDSSNVVPHASPLLDAKRGIEMIRARAREWGIDSSKVGVMGFSAGGHLASTLGTHFEEINRPDFMVLLYPVVTIKANYTHRGSRTELLGEQPAQDLVNQYSNELQVTRSTPPTFIVHSQDDEAVPVENSLQLYQALRNKHVPTEMHLFPSGGHGYSMALKSGRLSVWSHLLVKWLNDI